MSQATLSPTSSRSARRALLPVLLGLTLALAAPATVAHAAATGESETTVSWSVRPADTAQGRDRPNFAYELNPGGTLGDALFVTNRSAEPIVLDVYAADGFLTPDGSLDILAGGEQSSELGSWVDIDASELSLASGESAEVPFTVAVPAATPPGDYAAGVVASMLVTADNGTVTERRLGSRVHLRVLGDLAPALTVSDVSVDYHGTLNPIEPGSATVTYTLVNTGNARLDPGVTVSLAGPFGWAPVDVADDAPELLPGSSIERTVQLAGVAPLGLVTAEVTSSSEVVSRTLAGSSPASFDPVLSTGAASTAAVPWTALVALLLLGGLVAWRIVAVRRRKAAQERAIAEAVAAAKAEGAAGTAETAAPLASAGSVSPGSP